MLQARILLTAQSALFREGLKRILAGDRFSIVREERSLPQALAFLHSTDQPVDMILYEHSESASLDLDCLATIGADFPQVVSVVLTGGVNPHTLQRAVQAGARGILPNMISPAALNLALQLLLMGENLAATPANVSAGVGSSLPAIAHVLMQPRIPLSAREDEILELLKQGVPNKVIARNLNLAEATVKVHLKSLLRKIEVSNRTQAAIWAMNRSAGIDKLAAAEHAPALPGDHAAAAALAHA